MDDKRINKIADAILQKLNGETSCKIKLKQTSQNFTILNHKDPHYPDTGYFLVINDEDSEIVCEGALFDCAVYFNQFEGSHKDN